MKKAQDKTNQQTQGKINQQKTKILISKGAGFGQEYSLSNYVGGNTQTSENQEPKTLYIIFHGTGGYESELRLCRKNHSVVDEDFCIVAWNWKGNVKKAGTEIIKELAEKDILNNYDNIKIKGTSTGCYPALTAAQTLDKIYETTQQNKQVSLELCHRKHSFLACFRGDSAIRLESYLNNNFVAKEASRNKEMFHAEYCRYARHKKHVYPKKTSGRAPVCTV